MNRNKDINRIFKMLIKDEIRALRDSFNPSNYLIRRIGLNILNNLNDLIELSLDLTMYKESH